ncbi:hypothetical protein KZO77_01700 [Prevotella melaninogenica]|jgi:hypothetical protein|uniref:Uncharacterized protein n=1 Tax=Prevotella melaninogenica TaxID=28132 RepID=A0ABS6Y525_9BACT|nr:hypothetical protein [Prevotella melaninogenica]MBW4753755.1 hypothetical protein [Prevotella melaninogenica]
MNKEIKYNGLSTVPPDNTCQDGDSAMLLNLVPEDGALKPVSAPKLLLQLGENKKVIYIHKTISFSNYIIQDIKTFELYVLNANEKLFERAVSLGAYRSLSHVNAIGNTLLLFTEEYIIYFLWKQGQYVMLGNHVPNLQLSFGLRGKPRIYSLSDESHSTFNVNFERIDESRLYEVWTEDNQKKITSQIMAKVNKFLADQTIKEGRFALPFFVRYALRLYDGSLVCHSAPILMNPSTKTAPVVFWNRVSGKEGYTEAECDIMLVSAGIDYQLLPDGENSHLRMNDWKDIIKSVDVFISKPIYTYDQSGNCKSFADTDNLDTKFIGALDISRFSDEKTIERAGLINLPVRKRAEDTALLPISVNGTDLTSGTPGGRENPLGKYYVEWKYSKLYTLFFSKDSTYPKTTISLPEHTDDKNREMLENVQNFYFLKSISINELSTSERKDIVVNKEYLQSLTTRETMTDDYLSHDRITAKYSQTYNGRINLSGIRRELFQGFMAGSMFSYANNSEASWELKKDGKVVLDFGSLDYRDISIQTMIEEGGERYIVNSYVSSHLAPFVSSMYTNGDFAPTSWGCYVFYPNTHATMMRIHAGIDTYEVKLKPHDFLNGAYGVIDYELIRKQNTTHTEPPTKLENIIDVPNKIYTSEINNPFFFPVTGINTIGTGRILGIATAAKALSEGQFGQFPLYAFTDEGVWALEVNSTGGYSAKQPITRDVCLSSKSITQIDSAVLFTTDRGIMLLQGSQAMCISDVLNGENAVPITVLPKIDKILEHADLSKGTLRILPFMDFVRDCRMIYDYEHQRIIAYNTSKEYNCNYAYIFSLKSKQWGMMQSNIADNVNSYPDALAVLNDGSLVNFSDETDEVYKSIVVSRPIKLDAYDIHKSVDTIIQRGVFKKGHVKSILYASNDLYNWVPVWSSIDHYLRGFRGTPYKYIRIVLLANLSNNEGITGCSVQFTPRLTNQSR